MKRIILALSALLVCLSASAQKKSFTLEQIANDKFPNVEKYLLPPVWESGDILQVSTMEFGVLKRERKFYNVITNLRKALRNLKTISGKTPKKPIN